eukprot:364426-Chlamydomonas_euryale.AAC.41
MSACMTGGLSLCMHSAAGNKPPAAVRTWLRIEVTGESTVVQADKYKLTGKLGIQTRDLRLLDPHFTTTYPSCILCRDKSVVVNLEHIKVMLRQGYPCIAICDRQEGVIDMYWTKARPGGWAKIPAISCCTDAVCTHVHADLSPWQFCLLLHMNKGYHYDKVYAGGQP